MRFCRSRLSVGRQVSCRNEDYSLDRTITENLALI